MFDKEFFPTPKSVIRKMLSPYLKGDEDKYSRDGRHSLTEMTILEPSAGKGDILDFITEEYKYSNRGFKKMYCIEQNTELQYILKEKNYKVIADDFLDYTGDYLFDLIIMNPPFSNGDKHLLKAWDILDEGDIVCLLNEETIKNPYTETRKLLAKIIVDAKGTVEYLGPVFKQSENITSVNVCLVRLSKNPDRKKLDFEFVKVTSEDKMDITEKTIQDPIATRDVIGNMIIQYNKLKEVFIEHMKVEEALHFYSQGLLNGQYTSVLKIITELDNSDKKGRYNEFCDKMKSNIWNIVLKNSGMSRYMTHQVRENFQKFCEQQGYMDFTKENVYNIIKTLMLNKDQILKNAITEVFDIFTKYHDENRCHIEGWKTNDKWKVNKRIILPYGVRYGEYCSNDELKQRGSKFDLDYRKESEYSDIDKVMCYIEGVNYESCYSINQSLNAHINNLGYVRTGEKFINQGESQFFNYKFWKKGTLHLEFKDVKLWEEFNMRACNGKNWLPEAEKKTWQESKVPVTLFKQLKEAS